MKQFKTMTAIKQASVESLRQVKGISEKDAMNIYSFLNGDK